MPRTRKEWPKTRLSISSRTVSAINARRFILALTLNPVWLASLSSPLPRHGSRRFIRRLYPNVRDHEGRRPTNLRARERTAKVSLPRSRHSAARLIHSFQVLGRCRVDRDQAGDFRKGGTIIARYHWRGHGCPVDASSPTRGICILMANFQHEIKFTTHLLVGRSRKVCWKGNHPIDDGGRRAPAAVLETHDGRRSSGLDKSWLALLRHAVSSLT